MDITTDIHTLSDFKKNASQLIKQARDTKRSIILTVNGLPAAVIQDPASYQELVDARERAHTVFVLQKRQTDVDKGVKMRSAEKFFAEFSKKYGVAFEDVDPA
ncbi:MAG TPA: type II toxin-antitoxin system Phd/YefM family antitoxin [Pyrinomonadaceae bacterium]